MEIPSSANHDSNQRARSTVADAMVFFWQSLGMVPPAKKELDDLPPWTEEEADAFERNINEAFEQVEDADLPP